MSVSVNNTKKILITGASGAIGIHVVKHLLVNTDYKIIIVDSFKNKHKGNFERITDTDVVMNNKFRIEHFVHDLTVEFNENQIEKFKDVNFIVNLASLSDVEDSIHNPVEFCENNVKLMLTMLSFAQKCTNLEKFIQFSTDEVYGPLEKNVTLESGHLEGSAHKPSNPYAASKACQENLCYAWWRSFDVPIIITNTMNNFGEMQGLSKYPVKIQNAIEFGEVIDIHMVNDDDIGTRFYIHSEQVADAVLFILNKDFKIKYSEGVKTIEKINIVGVKRSNLELARDIAKIMNKKLKYRLVNFHSKRPGHDPHYGLNGDKLAKMGWVPKKSFEETLRDAVLWQKENVKWIKNNNKNLLTSVDEFASCKVIEE